jgi:hypothetical protein
MGELPVRQRRALVLRELEGRSYDEISADLGVNGAVVRGLLNRARNTMRAGASALVPPALVARMVGSQPAVRAVELADPPGTSALLAKATAAAAAGAVAVVAVTGTPVSERARVPHAEARVQPPALDRGLDADRRSDLRPRAASADSAGRRSASPDGTRRPAGDRGSGRERLEFAQRPDDASGGRAGEGLPERDAPAAAPRRRSTPLGTGPVRSGDDGPTGGSPGGPVPATSSDVEDDDGPAGADGGPEDADDGPEDATPVAGFQPPDDDAADDDDDVPAPAALQVAASPETAAEDDDDEGGAGD